MYFSRKSKGPNFHGRRISFRDIYQEEGPRESLTGRRGEPHRAHLFLAIQFTLFADSAHSILGNARWLMDVTERGRSSCPSRPSLLLQ